MGKLFGITFGKDREAQLSESEARTKALEERLWQFTDQENVVKEAGRIAESDFPNDFFYDPNFIPANSGAGYGLYPLNYFRANAQAERLAQSNGFYYRVLEIVRDHICGQGLDIDVSTTNPELQPLIPCIEKLCRENFFGDENQVDQRYHQWIFEALMSGMLALTAKVRGNDGFVEYGDLPARWIVDLIQNPYNASDVVSVKTQPGDWMPTTRLMNGKNVSGVERKTYNDGNVYPVIRYNREPFELDEHGKPKEINGLPVINKDFQKLTGSVFLFRFGNLRGQKFGQGAGFHIHDLCTELEQIIFLFRRAYEVQLNLVLWLKIKNADQKAIDKAAEVVLPTAPLPFVSDGNVELEMLSPELRPADLTEYIKTLGRFISGIIGIPEFMMGDGTGTNVATAEQQTPALYQKFNVFARKIESHFSFMLSYAMGQANKYGQLYNSTEENGVSVRGETVELTAAKLKQIEIKARFLPYERNNQKDLFTGLKELVDSTLALLTVKINDQSIIAPEAIQDFIINQMGALGFNINKDAMKARADTMDSLSGASKTGSTVNMKDLANVKQEEKEANV